MRKPPGGRDGPGSHSVPHLIRLLALAIGFIAVVAPTTADPDLWGHVVFGRDTVQARSIPAADPYSFTSDRPWINHEWLAEVLMYVAYAAGGATGLVYLKAIVLCAVVACVVAALRHWTFRPLHHDGLVAVALVGTFTRYHPVRPQLFSLALFALLLLLLTEADRGHLRKLVWVPPVFAAWANLHGGFLVGLAVLGVWAAVRIVRLPGERRITMAIVIAAAAATLLNPYGAGLWRFLWETVGTSRPEIRDWQPTLTAGPLVLIPWTVVVLTAGFALWRARKTGIAPSAAAIAALLFIGSMRIGRLDAFFALSVVMLLGPVFGRRVESPGVSTTRVRPARPAAAAGTILVLIAGAIGIGRRGSCIEMRNYPEPEATAFLQERRGRVLTLFDWGQYAIWHLAPRLEVSMDGRRETVYSDELLQSHLRLYRGEPGSTSLVRELAPDLIWLRTGSRAVPLLQREGWSAAFSGPVSVVLEQRAEGPARTVEHAAAAPRCFPER